MKLRIGLIGCGAIGNVLARAVDKAEGFRLVAIYDQKSEKAQELQRRLQRKPKIARSFKEFLAEKKDLTVEAAAYPAVAEYGKKILEGSDLMIMSTAAFVIYPNLYSQLKETAAKAGRKIYLPSGAIAGVDGIKSAVGKIDKVILTSTKNPKSIQQTDYLAEKGIILENLKTRTVIFEGSAKEAAHYFPENLNVASTLSLAGVGAEKTKVVFVADPDVAENRHEIKASGAFGEFRAQTKNVPSPDNPRTSFLAALSAAATLYEIAEPFQVGT